jgi:hypothetical protein
MFPVKRPIILKDVYITRNTQGWVSAIAGRLDADGELEIIIIIIFPVVSDIWRSGHERGLEMENSQESSRSERQLR